MRKVQLTTLVMLLITAFAMSGCGGTDYGTFAINTSGGAGSANGGVGGDGGLKLYDQDLAPYALAIETPEPVMGLIVTYAYGTGNPITVTSTGTVDASFTASNPNGNLGNNPLYITNDTLIAMSYTPPETGVAYFGESYQVYISDGDEGTDDQPVTGIQVAGGRTLTFGENDEGSANVSLQNDFVNNGTVTTLQMEEPFEARFGLVLDCGAFINRGKISLEGAVPGQRGGFFVADCYFNIHNMGPIDTFGAHNAEGRAGSGGGVYLHSYRLVENTAIINSYGGNATGTEGDGGYPGVVNLDGETIYNSGAINAYSGNGVEDHEPIVERGVVLGYFDGPIGSIGYNKPKRSESRGPILNSGTIKTYGGTSSSGWGDNAGFIMLGVYGGRTVKNSGSLYAYGGAALGADSRGGNGAPISIGMMSEDLFGYYLDTNGGNFKSPVAPKPSEEGIAFDIQVSGNLVVNGGSCLSDVDGYGGNGGFITVIHAGGYDSSANKLELVGYGAINTAGGSANIGGFGGSVVFGHTRGDAFLPGVLNTVPIYAKGGNGLVDPETNFALGGRGGSVEFIAMGSEFIGGEPTKPKVEEDSFSDVLSVINLAPIFTAGGTSHNAGPYAPRHKQLKEGSEDRDMFASAGHVLMAAFGDIDNSGSIYADGGDDLGDLVTEGTGFGGHSGFVGMYSAFSSITNTGNINASGGSGAFSGGHCDYYFEFYDDQSGKASDDSPVSGVYLSAPVSVDCPASITANGGDANPSLEYSRGGNGAIVILDCAAGPGAVTHGSISARAGTGWEAGETNDIVIGGILVQEGTARMYVD